MDASRATGWGGGCPPGSSLSRPLPRSPNSPGTEGTEDPAATPQHPSRHRPQGHSCGAIADAQKTCPQPAPAHKQAPPRGPHPTAVAGGPSGALGPAEARSEPHSLARREPRPSAGPPSAPARPPESRPAAEGRGRRRRPRGRASLPRAEVSARGTGGAGAGGFISPGGGPPIDGARAVHCALRYGNAVAAGEGRGGEGRGAARDAGTRAPRAPQGREGRCGEGASGQGADARRTGGRQAGSPAAGRGERGAGSGREPARGGAEMERGSQRRRSRVSGGAQAPLHGGGGKAPNLKGGLWGPAAPGTGNCRSGLSRRGRG